jgi:hypothetical protein
MKLFKIFFCFFLINTFTLKAQKEATPKNRPALGIKTTFRSGKFRFPTSSIYHNEPFDAYTSVGYGLFAQVFITKRFYLQLEYGRFERKYFSNAQYVYHTPPPLDQDVFYKINGSQRINDAGLLGYYQPIDYKFLHPFACIGFTSGGKKDREIYQYESGFGEKVVSNLLSRAPDDNFIIGLGTDMRFGQHFKFFIEARFQHTQTNVKTQEFKTVFVLPTNMYLNTWVGSVGVAWKF